MAKSTVNKKDLVADGTSVGLGIVGGVGAGYAANYLEQQTFMQGKQQYIPAGIVGLSLLAIIFVKQKQVKDIAMGAAIIGGTELVERMMVKSGLPGSVAVQNGVPPTPRGLGFVPKIVPEYLQAGIVRTPGGVVVK